MIIYLDDILIIGSDKDSLIREFGFAIFVLGYLGFILNKEKSVSVPFQEIELLGLLVNCLDLSVSLPEEKVASVVQLCEEVFVEQFYLSSRNGIHFGKNRMGDLRDRIPRLTTGAFNSFIFPSREKKIWGI